MDRRVIANKSICWGCLHAVPDPDLKAGCPWSKEAKPVKGWKTMQRTQVNGARTVLSCPLYKEG